MLPVRIPRRVRLSDGTGTRYLRTLHREEAQALEESGVIVVDETRGQQVVSFRLQGAARLRSTVRRGSFGVRREHVSTNHQYGLSGGIVFSHRETYEDLAAA